jgi:hypothetical protein
MNHKTMENKSENKIYGIIGTLLFHGIALLIFYLIVFITPLPPFPEEGGGGLEVNFGTDEFGSGDVQPIEVAGNEADVDETQEPVIEKVKITSNSSAAEKVITHETGEEVKMNLGKSEAKASETAMNTESEKPFVEEKKVDNRILYKKKKGSLASAASEGENGGKGDQGSPDGSFTTKYHGNGGKGRGNGFGDGEGDGDGSGKYGKSGITYSLIGRKSSKLPVPKASFSEEGRVVVEIKVDQNGVVVSAKPGAKGSTTQNPQLLEIARGAAMSATFNVDNDAPDVQKGTIVYNFYLK